MKTVKIKERVLLNKDASEMRVEFYYDPNQQMYAVMGVTGTVMPDEVADAFVASNSSVEIVETS